MKFPRSIKYKSCSNPDCDTHKGKGFYLSTALDEKKFCSLECESPDVQSGAKKPKTYKKEN